jgi:hypothetical protein
MHLVLRQQIAQQPSLRRSLTFGGLLARPSLEIEFLASSYLGIDQGRQGHQQQGNTLVRETANFYSDTRFDTKSCPVALLSVSHVASMLELQLLRIAARPPLSFVSSTEVDIVLRRTMLAQFCF